MLISTKGRYALRVMTDLAEHPTEGYIPLKDIAQRQGISEKYLESIIKLLVKGRLLAGLRGKGGGYKLMRAPEAISVAEILRLTEETLAPVACLEPGAAACERVGECRTLPLWQGLGKLINDYLENYALSDLLHTDAQGYDYVI
jgi:Rrf2 family protein